MKPSISVLAERHIGSSTMWSLAAATMILAGCGPQNPSFTEQSAVAPVSEQVDANAINGGTSTPGDRAPQSPAGQYGSWRPGDSTSRNGGSGGVGSGLESYDGLSLVTDSSTQQASSKVDILWVVDSSGSMREEQSYLGQNFSSFIGRLSQSNADFQVGITTTDVCDRGDPSLIPASLRYCPTLDGTSATHFRGSLVGQNGQRVLTRNTADLSNRFLSYTNVGINGSSYEHGLTAVKMAIQKSATGQNDGIVRSDAFLAVIVVSDEEDDGIGLGKTDSYTGRNFVQMGLTSYKYSSDDFIRDALAFKGAGQFSVSTITGTRMANGSMCTSPHSQPQEEGTQYINAARKSGGVVQSICDTNWSASLGSIGQDIAAQSSQVVLSQRPYASSIKVVVNGVASINWSYNGGNNAVKFDSGNVPAAGSVVQIQYYAAP